MNKYGKQSKKTGLKCLYRVQSRDNSKTKNNNESVTSYLNNVVQLEKPQRAAYCN